MKVGGETDPPVLHLRYSTATNTARKEGKGRGYPTISVLFPSNFNSKMQSAALCLSLCNVGSLLTSDRPNEQRGHWRRCSAGHRPWRTSSRPHHCRSPPP
ncbi:hypothetical protein Dimus_021211 [Dionaea muscipula]